MSSEHEHEYDDKLCHPQPNNLGHGHGHGHGHGYGYGVWLVPRSEASSSLYAHIRHTPHITIMCNMSEIGAKNLHDILMSKFQHDVHVHVDATCRVLSKSYSNDPLFGSGFDCSYNELEDFKTICEDGISSGKLSGDFSYTPHLTYCYSMDENHISMRNFEKTQSLPCQICCVDINHSNPLEWKVLSDAKK